MCGKSVTSEQSLFVVLLDAQWYAGQRCWGPNASPRCAQLMYFSGFEQVYSFAMICYELFEGRKPFSEMNASAAARAASMFDRRPPWGKMNRWLPP